MGNFHPAIMPEKITCLPDFLSNNKRSTLAKLIIEYIPNNRDKYYVIPAELIRVKLHEALLILVEFKEAYYTTISDSYHPIQNYSQTIFRASNISDRIVIAKIDMDLINKLSDMKDITEDEKILDREICSGQFCVDTGQSCLITEDRNKYCDFDTNFYLNWRPRGYKVCMIKTNNQVDIPSVLLERKLAVKAVHSGFLIYHDRHKEYLGLAHELSDEHKRRLLLKRLDMLEEDTSVEGEEGCQ